MNPKYPTLSKAPIIEGLINIQVKPRSEAPLKELAELRDSLAAQYPSSQELRTITAGFQLDAVKPPSQSVSAEVIGYRLERQDQPFVLMLTNNGLTVSRLKPYTTWDDLLNEARPIWKKYVEICKPEIITRVATRYINRIELPGLNLDFDDYLAAMPRVPKQLPDVLTDFLVRLVIPDKKSGSDVAVVQSLQGFNLEAQQVNVLVDVDVFKVVDFSAKSEEVWSLLEIMRDLKNCAFFSAITQKTLELLK